MKRSVVLLLFLTVCFSVISPMAAASDNSIVPFSYDERQVRKKLSRWFSAKQDIPFLINESYLRQEFDDERNLGVPLDDDMAPRFCILCHISVDSDSKTRGLRWHSQKQWYTHITAFFVCASKAADSLMRLLLSRFPAIDECVRRTPPGDFMGACGI